MNRSRPGPVVELLFLATVFTVTFAKLQWEVAGTLSLSDVLTGIFLVAWLGTRVGTGDRRIAWGAAVAGLFFLGFLAVYLIGFFNLETEQALAQWAKGMFKFLLHFLFLVVGLAYLARRSERFYWTTFAVFMAGFVANAVYGIVQLGTAEVLGINLDQSLLSPITGGASQINIYGAIEGASVFRPNALTGDPNHLGIELVIPLLVLTPLYLRLERGHRLKLPLALVLAFLLLVELATLSRSGLLGLAAGLLVLAVPYRHRLATPEFLLPLGAVAVVLGIVLAARWDFFEQVLRSRVDTSANGTSTHFDVYGFIPDVLSSNPFFGLGLNNFSVYYEFVTGRTNFGPHSFYVATLVETGLVGTALFVAFLVYLFQRLGAAARDRPRARLAADPAARLGDDRRARRHDRRERLLPDDVLLLLLRVRAARARGADRLLPPARREGRRPDDLVPARRAGRGRPLRPRRRRGGAGAGVEVEVVSPASFRHFGIAYGPRDRGQPAPAAVAGAAAAGVPLQLRPGGAPGGAGRRPRPRALAPVRARGARDREAVRRPALGDGRRAGAAGALALPAAPAARAARHRRVRVPRRRGARARRARGARRPEPRSRSRSRSASRTSRRTCSSSAASRRRRGSTSSSRRRRGCRA